MDSFTESLTESITSRSLGEWKGMEGNGREVRGETFHHGVQLLDASRRDAMMFEVHP